ncbi:MAG: hemerythrin domain-containing protein [Labilithrix sp.]|nr:hemerythrin domain-containing protein [Labilithrix sp.]
MNEHDPFAQLERSHRRLEERLSDLADVATRARAEGGEGARLDREAIALARDVAGFFARAVRRHEEDEESSLFPRLRERAELAPLLARLAEEHREHASLHARLDRALDGLDRDPPDAGALEELVATSDALAGAYRAHLDDEEKTLFPAARAALDAAALDAIAREMSDRRGGAGGGGGRRR